MHASPFSQPDTHTHKHKRTYSNMHTRTLTHIHKCTRTFATPWIVKKTDRALACAFGVRSHMQTCMQQRSKRWNLSLQDPLDELCVPGRGACVQVQHEPMLAIAMLRLQKLHPAGLRQDWADKLFGKVFISDTDQSTHEHYLQVRGSWRARGSHARAHMLTQAGSHVRTHARTQYTQAHILVGATHMLALGEAGGLTSPPEEGMMGRTSYHPLACWHPLANWNFA